MSKRRSKINWVRAAVENVGGAYKFAELWSVSFQAVYNWMEQGTISHFSVDAAVRFSELTGISIGHLTGIEGLSLKRVKGHRVRKMRGGGRRASAKQNDQTQSKHGQPDPIRAANGDQPKNGTDAGEKPRGPKGSRAGGGEGPKQI